MGKSPKCKHCDKIIEDISLAIKHTEKSKFYFCSQECHDLKYPPKQKKLKSQADPYFKELMEYIDNLYNHNVNFPLLNTQLKKAKEEYGFTTKGILLTLKYHQEILGLTFEEKFGIISILNYYYKQAKEFYIKKIEISNKIKGFDFNNDVIVVKKSEKELEFDDI